MGDIDPSASLRQDEGGSRSQTDGMHGSSQGSQFHIPFQSQVDNMTFAPPKQPTADFTQYGSTTFEMASMMNALPQNLSQRGHYQSDVPGAFSPASVFQMQHAAQYSGPRGSRPDPIDPRAQQQRFLAPHFEPGPLQQPVAQRRPGPFVHHQGQYPRLDVYDYGMGVPHYNPIDYRFGQQPFPVNGPMSGEMPQFSRRASEPTPVPSFPRGPPRKPKQSGHALWVGNLPPAATVIDLKDHFSRDATNDIESLFLISKSNCAFVNYRSEAACVAAMNRFHDSRFNGVRLVCRLRRGSTATASSPTVGEPPSTPITDLPITPAGEVKPENPSGPVIVGQDRHDQATELQGGESNSSTDAKSVMKVPEKFFIVKSLTVQDLEASVLNGTWATQSHNEEALNRAFDEAENVYLIFSANKSGEYFGYARMASPISGEPVNLGPTAETDEAKLAGTPQSIPTPATETAPRGRIIDDSARGTIFWEAELSDNDDESPVKESSEGQHWGRQFRLEWMSTSRLPFFRTRGLRNPWNANREVKIARDGTELEPGVGRRLVQMFHRMPQQNQFGAAMPQPGMVYR